ncbi:hypothetical protein AOLI_G00155240 [Acnodon oligacanthus]
MRSPNPALELRHDVFMAQLPFWKFARLPQCRAFPSLQARRHTACKSEPSLASPRLAGGTGSLLESSLTTRCVNLAEEETKKNQKPLETFSVDL